MMRRFLVVVLAVGSLAGQTLNFTTVSLAAGSSPKSIHLASFNRSPYLDIAVVNAGGIDQDNVTVLMGSASMMFSQPLVTPTGGLGSLALTTGDFNHDGKTDLAVANNVSNNVSILMGNGDGTFQQAVTYGAHEGPVAIARADFNGDGNLDLAVVNSFSGDVTILLGNRDGTFGAPHNISVGSSPTDVKAGDFNGDGIPDLAISNGALGGRIVQILLGNGDGTFRAGGSVKAGNEPFALALGDFNLDGKADLAVANLASNNLSVLLGNGNATFQPAVNYAAGRGTLAVKVGDFNLDNKPDLAACADVSADVLVFLGNGDGTFQTPQSFSTSSACNSVAVGDINADGKPDIAVANTNGVVLFINNGQ